jgi:hypothetical protein
MVLPSLIQSNAEAFPGTNNLDEQPYLKGKYIFCRKTDRNYLDFTFLSNRRWGFNPSNY